MDDSSREIMFLDERERDTSFKRFGSSFLSVPLPLQTNQPPMHLRARSDAMRLRLCSRGVAARVHEDEEGTHEEREEFACMRLSADAYARSDTPVCVSYVCRAIFSHAQVTSRK